jgi:c(7)-type cytochrome triheme protein
MRNPIVYSLLAALLGSAALLAQDKAPPTKLVFPSKLGNVTFDHTAHAKREKDDCKICHPALFPQDAKAPLEYKPVHRTAENKKISCGACHRPDGTAFASRGNCSNSKCHVRAAAAK